MDIETETGFKDDPEVLDYIPGEPVVVNTKLTIKEALFGVDDEISEEEEKRESGQEDAQCS